MRARPVILTRMDIRRVARSSIRVDIVAAVALAASLLIGIGAVPVVVAANEILDATQGGPLDRPPLPDELPTGPEISKVADTEGDVIAELSGPVRRQPVPLEAIPGVVIDAVIATEDQEFYEHPGVHHPSMARAAGRNLVAGQIAEGASTITQQYVRMTLLDPEQSFDRKVHEILWAVELEKRLTKHEILERYLNDVYLGEGVYGIGTAADHYFSRSVGELGLAEAALLAGTIRSPAATNPVENPETARERRDIVVRQMLAQGFIASQEADEVLGSEIELDVREEAPGEPFWVDMVKRLVYDPSADLQPGLQEAVGETVEERITALFEGGLVIHTTLDDAVNEHARDTLASYLDDPLEDPLGALISVEHETGAVRAIALGPREFGDCPQDQDDPCPLTQINPAVAWAGGSGRQSGSAFKPFVAAAALDAGFDLDEEYDSPSGEAIDGCSSQGEDYEPRNFGDEDYDDVELPEAMRRSVNVYFAKLARDVGIEEIVESARSHGLVDSPNLADFTDPMCSIALGSAEVFPLEMAVGYGTWANDGERCDPYLIERIEDRHGEIVYEHEDRCEQAVDEEVAEQMRDLLREPVGSGGTASMVGDRLGDGVFGKTGTTNNSTDAWFVGSDGDHTVATWIGFEQPQPMEGLTIGGTRYEQVTGGSIPASVFTDFLEGLDDLDD